MLSTLWPSVTHLPRNTEDLSSIPLQPDAHQFALPLRMTIFCHWFLSTVIGALINGHSGHLGECQSLESLGCTCVFISIVKEILH